jgi:CMP/dCMP kinase
MTADRIVITIDGPSGAGKTTVSRQLAQHLGYIYVDTGALYRGVAYKVKDAGINPDDEDALFQLCARLDMKFEIVDNSPRLIVDGRDVTDGIRTPEISMLASAVSARPVVRKYLLTVQREMGEKKGAVFEGRDMGTVVFPEAAAKFYLDASPGQRAKRRYLELKSDPGMTLEKVQADMTKRDKDDSTRDLAPLKPAGDAVIIDSSGKTIEGVVEIMLSHVNLHRNA